MGELGEFGELGKMGDSGKVGELEVEKAVSLEEISSRFFFPFFSSLKIK
jgi:hypothetical protein